MCHMLIIKPNSQVVKYHQYGFLTDSDVCEFTPYKMFFNGESLFYAANIY